MRVRARARLTRCIAFALAFGIASAQAVDPATTFEAAIALEATQPAEAATRLEQLAGEHPDLELAPDALAEAATLCEERVFDPARALTDWRALVRAYPSSRVAARAQVRIAELERVLAPGVDGAQVGRLERLVAGSGDHPTREQRAQVEAFLAEAPAPALRARATYWLARAAEDANEVDVALRYYDDTARIEGPWAARADRAAAELLKRRSRFAEAETAYQKLSRHTDAVSRLALKDGLPAVRRARRLRAMEVGAWLLIALFALGHAAVGRRHVLPVPMEVRFLAPVALLFTVVAAGQHRTIALAVGVIGTGGVVVTWLAAAARRAIIASRGPLSFVVRLVLAAMAAAAILAVAYLAIRRWDLVEQVRETLMAGPDR